MNSTRDDSILKSFGNNLKKIRLQKKISLRKLADEVEIDFSQIHRIEKGTSNPTLTMILKLAIGLNISHHDLMEFEDKISNGND